MSMFRKTALTSAIIGAGLVSTAGAAFAGNAPHEGHGGHHESSHTTSNTTNSCVNEAGGSIDNGGAELLGGVAGSQGAIGLNVLCDVLNNSLNGNGSNNTLSVVPEESAEEPADEEEGGSEGARTFAAPSSVPQGTTVSPIQS